MMAAVDMVEDMGYRVLEAPNAGKALSHLSDGQTIDILLTDVNLPDLRGPELAARAREMHPGLPVVFATGYPMSVPPELADAPTAVVNKPYWEEDLRKALETVSAR
ncbi:Response regulator receiver domain-containing protein [Faunimonas pinastri]|uniref:Response regulator receiver domain-containing protein n=2 Tax=Faunimonas pinastri TaxID=1855383 RepID=A0A1H9LXE6_9HYPH|nr:Response regulator receiver domain-containing protein [Faunimonas pinastri]